MDGSIDGLAALFEKLGVSVQELMDAQVQAGLEGEQSWFEVEVALQSLSEVAQAGLGAMGNFQHAFNNLLTAGDRGAAPLQALVNLAQEFSEAGINSLQDAQAALAETGAFTEQEISALFTALEQRGIGSMEALMAAASNPRLLGGIIADMNVLGITFDGATLSIEEMRDRLTGVSEAIESIPENIQANVDVDVNITETVRRVVEETVGGEESDVQEEFAKGGMVHKPTRALIGEAGSEAVLPLTRIGGEMGVLASVGGGGTGGNVFNIDARGAAPGVENRILSALDDLEERAIEGAIETVLDIAERGGLNDILER